MSREAKRGRLKTRTPLSRERVLLAAIGLADKEGIEALTMRRLGQKLGVEAMSLYKHVADKERVLDGMVDVVFGEIGLPPDGSDWKMAMRRRAIAARDVLRRHPWAIGLMESRTRPGPANLRHHDAVLGILAGAGFSVRQATHVYNVLDSYIYGFALQERTLPFSTPEELAQVGASMLPEMPADVYPHLATVATELVRSGFNYGDEFEFGLDLILGGLERLQPRRRSVAATERARGPRARSV